MPFLRHQLPFAFFNFIVFHFGQTKNTTKKIKVNQDRIEKNF
jgi:hypothetical protein